MSGSSVKHARRVRFIQFGTVYVLLSLAIIILPSPATKTGYALIWLLGPLGSLTYGRSFLVPFFAGTIIIGGLLWALLNTASLSKKTNLRILLVIVWLLFGAISHAPSI